MSHDKELEAMKQLVEALAPLDEEAKVRVLKWAADRFKVSMRKVASSLEPDSPDAPQTFKDLPSLFDATNPKTEAEKVLVVGYWLQVLQGKSNLDSYSVNSQLKHLGHGVGNVTKAFDSLKTATPRLAIQTEKSGQARQAHKKLKITVEGIRKVQTMIHQASQLQQQEGGLTMR